MSKVRHYKPKLSEVTAIKWNRDNLDQILLFCEGTDYVPSIGSSMGLVITKGGVPLCRGLYGWYVVKDLKNRVWIESAREFEASFELIEEKRESTL